MNPFIFLLFAVVLSVLGTIVLWARHRETKSTDSSIGEFDAKMKALQPQDQPPRRGGPRRG